MAYQANIPLSTDKLSTSQGDINGNFQAIDAFVNIDHEAFNGGDAGKHKKATFPVHVAPAAVGAAEVGIYAANSGGVPELFINKTASQVPFTAALKAMPGWTYLPSGIIIQWAQGSMNANEESTSVVLPRLFPTAALYFQATPTARPSGMIMDTIVCATNGGAGATQLVTVQRGHAYQGTGCNFNVLAIGY